MIEQHGCVPAGILVRIDTAGTLRGNGCGRVGRSRCFSAKRSEEVHICLRELLSILYHILPIKNNTPCAGVLHRDAISAIYLLLFLRFVAVFLFADFLAVFFFFVALRAFFFAGM